MNSTCKYLFVAILCFAAEKVLAQHSFWDRITVRKAFESGTTDDYQPALLSLTFPQHADNSFLINAGVGYKFDRDRKLHSDLSAFAVYDRNTLTDYQQKNYKIGVSSNHSFDLQRMPLLAIFGTSTIQYLHDYVGDDHSLLITSYWQPIYKNPGQVHVGGYVASNHLIDYYFTPQLGIEHQQVLSSAASTTGFDFRGYFNAGGSLIIKRKSWYHTADLREELTAKLLRQPRWSKGSAKALHDTVMAQVPDGKRELMEKRYWIPLVEFNVSYAARFSIINHHSGFDPYIPLFSATATFYPLLTRNFAVSSIYSNGSNPVDGTVKQAYWLLSLSFRK